MLISQLFPSKFLKAADLQGRRVTVTIDRLHLEKVGPQQEQKPVLTFRKASKSMILNRTNAMTIAKLYGDNSDGWAGKSIVLYATEVRAFGSVHSVVRVEATIPPAAKPPTTPNQPPENQLDDLDDVIDAEDVDDVPFSHHASDEEPDPFPDGVPLAAASDDDTQREYSTEDYSTFVWESPLEAQGWAVQAGLAADAKDAQATWVQAVRACNGFDRTKAAIVYARYVELLRARQPV